MSDILHELPAELQEDLLQRSRLWATIDEANRRADPLEALGHSLQVPPDAVTLLPLSTNPPMQIVALLGQIDGELIAIATLREDIEHAQMALARRRRIVTTSAIVVVVLLLLVVVALL